MIQPVLKAAIVPFALIAASCNASAGGDNAPTASTATTASAQPDGTPFGYAPQVTIAGDHPFTVQELGTFNEPWAMAVEPGTGRIFVNEKPGTTKFIDPATGTIGTVTGGPEKTAQTSQGGLGDIAFAPDYATSGMIYLSWAEDVGEKAKRAVAARGKLVCDSATTCRIEGLTRIWQQSMASTKGGHFSHRFAFSPDGQYLFIASGDRQEKEPAQDLTNNLGAIVRLLPDGTPAPGNPFADRGAPTNQIWSYGHRNMLGIAFAPDGRLWVMEHGPAGGDELNLVARGANYGWPVRSYGNEYTGGKIEDHSADDGFTKPLAHWTPVIAPGDMIAYSGDLFGAWNGTLFVTGLRSKALVHVAAGGSEAITREVARWEFPERLRAVVQAADGSILVSEDEEDGRILRLTPRS